MSCWLPELVFFANRPIYVNRFRHLSPVHPHSTTNKPWHTQQAVFNAADCSPLEFGDFDIRACLYELGVILEVNEFRPDRKAILT